MFVQKRAPHLHNQRRISTHSGRRGTSLWPNANSCCCFVCLISVVFIVCRYCNLCLLFFSGVRDLPPRPVRSHHGQQAHHRRQLQVQEQRTISRPHVLLSREEGAFLLLLNLILSSSTAIPLKLCRKGGERHHSWYKTDVRSSGTPENRD